MLTERVDKVPVVELSEKTTNLEVRGLDPLDLDRFFAEEFIELNEAADTETVINKLREVVPDPDGLALMQKNEAMAASRDIGMMAAAVTRHGVNISEEVPEMETALINLSKVTGEVPRDSVFSYGPRNPQDERMRTFTSDPQERVFIESFVEGMEGLDSTINHLSRAHQIDPAAPEFVQHMDAASETFQSMIRGIVRTRREVDPGYFYQELRPYFPPMEIGGEVYMAPGGAQMPVLIVDHLLWGSDQDNETYRAYFADNTRYLPSAYKQVIEQQKGPSIVTQLERSVEREQNDTIGESVAVTINMFNQLQRFRAPHKKIADESFDQLRSDEDKGSGGYSNEILADLQGLTMSSRERLKQLQL